MTTSVNASLSRASSPESAGAAVVPSTSRSHVPNRREGYVMLFDSVQNTWVRVYLAVHDATVMHVLHTAGRYGRMVRPSLSLAKVSHVYCSADIPGVVDKHALLLVLYAASAHDLLCLRLQDKRLFGEWFQGLSTLWPETVTVSPIEELVKLKSLISPGLHSYLFGTSQTAAGAGSSTTFQREGSSVKHMQQHSAARMASLSATCPRRMIGGGGLLSAASTVNHHHSNVAGAFVAGMHGGYHRQPSLLFAKKQQEDGVDSSLLLSNSGHFTTNGSGSTTARRFADPNQKASLPIPPPSTSPLPVGRGSYATSAKSHYGAQKENQHVPMTSRVASSSTMRKQQASHHLRPSSSNNNSGGGGDGKIFRTVVDKGYGVAYPSPSPIVPTRTSTATPSVSARSSQERSATTVEPSHHSERRQEENSTTTEQRKDSAVESTAAHPAVEVDSCPTKPTPEAGEVAASSAAPSLTRVSSAAAAEEKQAGRTLADVVAPLPSSFAESRAELQARLVDLEIENVTLSANVLELESTVEQLRSTVSEWRRKHSSLEQQLAVQEKHFAQKYEEEKEQLRAALMEEVKSQFCAAKEKWDAREAEYRFQIETLTGAVASE